MNIALMFIGYLKSTLSKFVHCAYGFLNYLVRVVVGEGRYRWTKIKKINILLKTAYYIFQIYSENMFLFYRRPAVFNSRSNVLPGFCFRLFIAAILITSTISTGFQLKNVPVSCYENDVFSVETWHFCF